MIPLILLCAVIVTMVYYINYSMRNKATFNTDKSEFGLNFQANETCQFWYLTGDGFCDDEVNTELCYYDMGDCCDYPSDQSLCTECLCKEPPPIVDLWHKPGCKFGWLDEDNLDTRYEGLFG